MGELRACLTTLVFAPLIYASGIGLSVAGPDKCVLAPSLTLATCTGNQSTGVRENPPQHASDFPTGTAHLVVRDLTRDIVTDVIGIKYSFTNTSTSSGFLEYFGGNTNLFADNIGIAMGKAGRVGSKGTDGSFIFSGGDGNTGESWTGATIRSVGTIRSGLTGISLVVSGGEGGAAGTNGALCSGCDGPAGGRGGAGATLDVSGSGNIKTTGPNAQGILLSDTGGNGANGRGASLVGAKGGNGGAGGAGATNVLLSNQGDWSITTLASGATANAPGIRVQVVGGNGARGGNSTGASGGLGGVGGDGVAATGSITIGATDRGVWTVSTQGGNSDAVFVSARGGNGGESGDLQVAGTGPTGGRGGNAGRIVAWGNGGTLVATTRGDNSSGIDLETFGGNGGVGGGSGGTGGAGGRGGDGGSIALGSANFVATITTQGDKSAGVFLLSRGGDGGTGAGATLTSGGTGGAGNTGATLSVAGRYTIDTHGSESDGINALSYGGLSARGGNGFIGSPGGSDQARDSSPVSINVTGSIDTFGSKSSGIDAESVAGHDRGQGPGGGTGTGILGFSAAAGSAGAGGDVSVTNAARITTKGDQSTGITAASIGGGGGIGGPQFGIFYGSGNSGGIGGNGGKVTVANTGDLLTSGDDAVGIYAQSVGGSGGAGGVGASVIAGFGGKSARGGHGNNVSVTNSGTILTGTSQAAPGASAPAKDPICGKGCSAGIFAQSVGGGGGVAGRAGGGIFSLGGSGGKGGNGGNVSVVNTGSQDSISVKTTLDNSDAITAQSVGGGGGEAGGAVSVNPGAVLSVAVGGNGGAGGNGGTVTVRSQKGELSTSGDSSRGVTAQSIGGGGGQSGFAISAAAGVSILPALAIAIGGSSSVAGAGDAVDVSSSSDISTEGDDSAGIYAQSVGGGGGNGGFAIAAAAASSGAVSFGLGGAGGAAGKGGALQVVTADGSDIETLGDNSSGIFAQSTGGGGGEGGLTITAAGGTFAGGSISIGRSGGGGGNGGAVLVRTGTGSIHTAGERSTGLTAQSVAGSGGNGSMAIAATVTHEIGNLSFAMGGGGGAGGVGGDINVANHSNITTDDRKSDALFAQSVGGGGGSGGLSAAGGLLTGIAGKVSLNVAVGGNGGNGGKGGEVFVDNVGKLVTKGKESVGLTAQSIGGGGGSGGMALSGQIGGIGGSAGAINVSVGGNGGIGGDAGSVTVRNTGAISTVSGTQAQSWDPNAPTCKQQPCVKQWGILAQSVGGGGGVGGVSGTLTLSAFTGSQSGYSLNLNTSVGGKGGSAGLGGDVHVENSGAIQTVSAESSAIFAQSVSGGGGAGGLAVNYTIKPAQPAEIGNISSSVTVGGAGGSGQVGGDVFVLNSGVLNTTQYGSHGIFAQSVGGGGGQGGDTGSFQLSTSCVRWVPGIDCRQSINSNNSWRLTLKMGGAGGKGNHGGDVTVSNSADITTTGGGSDGINAASIGGGGGNAGNDSMYTFPPTGIPKITGDRQTTFRDLSIAIGGDGGAQGNGGIVTVTQTGHEIHTEGGGASGIWAQSVGGGGGTGKGGTVTASGQKPAVSVGGKGGAGGNGGAVTVNVLNGGHITTSGKAIFDSNGKLIVNSGAYGIFAQSVGGGGGFGGSARLQGIPGGGFIPDCDWCSQVSIGAGLPITLGGGGGGDGGAVTVNLDGSIETGSAMARGESSPGILAQSVGGGGGIAGYTAINPAGLPNLVDVFRGTFMGSGNSGGKAGPVSVTVNGDITTWGDASHGIMAQSAGSGKLTRVPTQTSKGGIVTIVFTGNLDAKGRGSAGIWAQSTGTGLDGFFAADDIKVTIGAGSVVTGGTRGDKDNGTGIENLGAGIELKDGAKNVVDNFGTVTSLGGMAIVHTGKGSLTINNHNTVTGDVLVQTTPSAANNAKVSPIAQADALSTRAKFDSNVFNNFASGILRSNLVDLGAGGKLFNSGSIVVGGDDVAASTQIIGNLIADSQSHINVDLNSAAPGLSADVDVLRVSGSAELSGEIVVNTLDLERSIGEQKLQLVSADGGVTFSDLSIVSASGSDIVQYDVLQSKVDQLDLAYTVDFAGPGVLARLNRNQDSLARYVQRLYVADELDNDTANAFIDLDGASFASDLNSMGAEVVVGNRIASLQSSLRFGDDLSRHDCQYEGRCSWSRIRTERSVRNSSADNLGFETSGLSATSSVQSVTAAGWQVGTAFAYETTSLESQSPATSAGNQFHLGVSLGRSVGAAEFSGSLAAGLSRFNTTRYLQTGEDKTMRSTQSVTSVAGRLGVGWNIGTGVFYLKPRVDLTAVKLMASGFDEEGESPFRLQVDSSDETYVALQPELELGAAFEPRPGMLVRPRVMLGATRFLGGAEPSADASFADSSGAAGHFETHTGVDAPKYTVTAGFDVQSDTGLIFELEGFKSSSDDGSDSGAGLNVRVPF